MLGSWLWLPLLLLVNWSFYTSELSVAINMEQLLYSV